MPADERELHVVAAEREPTGAVRREAPRVGTNVRRLREPGDPNLAREGARPRRERGRSRADDGERNVVEQTHLLGEDAVERAEPLQVAGRHIGDDADGRTDDLTQPGDLAGNAGAGLDDERVRFVGRGEEGQRHPDLVVQVRVGRVNGPPGREGPGEQFFRRGLAVGAGHGNHGTGDLVATRAPEQAQGPTRVRHRKDGESLDRRRAPLDDRAGRAGRARRLEKRMPVEPLAPERDEQIARSDGAGVRPHPREGDRATRRRGVEHRRNALRRPTGHAALNPSASCTMTRSSNGRRSAPTIW
jgi:hypothetical protein